MSGLSRTRRGTREMHEKISCSRSQSGDDDDDDNDDDVDVDDDDDEKFVASLGTWI